MRKILSDNLWMMITVGVFLAIVTVAKVGWGQEQKPLTPEQRIESLTRSLLNMKFNFAEEKALFAKEKNMNAGEMKITVQLQEQVMHLQKRIAGLEEQLKEANAKIAQLKMKPEIHGYDVAPGEVIDVPKE